MHLCARSFLCSAARQSRRPHAHAFRNCDAWPSAVASRSTFELGLPRSQLSPATSTRTHRSCIDAHICVCSRVFVRERGKVGGVRGGGGRLNAGWNTCNPARSLPHNPIFLRVALYYASPPIARESDCAPRIPIAQPGERKWDFLVTLNSCEAACARCQWLPIPTRRGYTYLRAIKTVLHIRQISIQERRVEIFSYLIFFFQFFFQFFFKSIYGPRRFTWKIWMKIIWD